jgi:hypothetical protein
MLLINKQRASSYALSEDKLVSRGEIKQAKQPRVVFGLAG